MKVLGLLSASACCALALVGYFCWTSWTLKSSASSKSRKSVFVAVLSRRAAGERRELIREMWRRAGDAGWDVVSNFAVCKRSQTTTTAQEEVDLEQEALAFGDLLVLDCEEGYSEGRLVQKVLEAMRVFIDHHEHHDFFMKVDDDSFVAWSRLRLHLENMVNREGWQYIYAGMPDMVDRLDWWFNSTESPNYDPWENWPYNYYPFHFAGGTGYLLGKDLLLHIVRDFMGDPISWNEDKAVGIAVFRANQSGLPVTYYYLKSDDGETDGLPFSGTWAEYPFVSQHQLSGKTIRCLAQLEASNAPGGLVDACYAHTPRLQEFMLSGPSQRSEL